MVDLTEKGYHKNIDIKFIDGASLHIQNVTGTDWHDRTLMYHQVINGDEKLTIVPLYNIKYVEEYKIEDKED